MKVNFIRNLLNFSFYMMVVCTLLGVNPVYSGTHFDRIVTIVLENTNYDEAFKDPYLTSLGQKGVVFSNFDALTHPSYPNYIGMVAGSTYGIKNDSQKTLDVKSIADLLEAKGLTWKNYAEGYPGNCNLKSTSGKYARKHVPFLSFKNIQIDLKRCAHVVAGTQFQKDWKDRKLPHYAYYTPDLNNDGHDTSLKYASSWLKKFLTPLLADQEGMKGTLIEVTFDESESHSGRNQILTIMIGPMVRAKYNENQPYGFYDVLKTVEDNFGLGSLGLGDVRANLIRGIWK